MSLRPVPAMLILLFLLCAGQRASAQRFLSDYDSTLFIRDTVRPILKRIENLHFSGYVQPQFQVAQAKGAPSFEGGNFADSSNNRFMLRRARIRLDYLLPSRGQNLPIAVFAFQFDITERGAFARDVFFKLFEPRKQHFSMTVGLFARPFGYEVNLSSGVRESPERGRMSQTLMPAERDLGAMISYESRKDSVRHPLFKLDAGFFNGPGLSGPTDFDSYKDFISRLALKPFDITRKISISAGLSLLYGGWAQSTRYRLQTAGAPGAKTFVIDSSLSNLGARAPRHYYGADAQLVFRHRYGKTEIRGEYWKGLQSGTASTTVNPGSLPSGPTYVRKFDGAFIYLLQNLFSPRWELVLKYDWYDPNREVKKKEIGAAGSNLTAADLRFNTLGAGLTYYFNSNVKMLAYYDRVRNETTALPAYSHDIKDDVLTMRIQIRF